MKKRILVLVTSLCLFLLLGSTLCFADSLDAINVTTNKAVVNPGEILEVSIDFGADLGAYTVDFAYDNNLFEYVSTDGGTPNDNGTRVRVVYYDSSGGTNTKRNIKIQFRAKEGIVTSNPTDISITAEGMANGDASVNYDDIGVPITKSVTVEPKYVDYTLDLTYTGDIIEGEEKEMKLSTKSSMGKNYAHVRLIAEAITPDGGTVKLLGKDHQSLEHDLIQSGWGEPEGYAIGGVNVNQVLNYTATFSKAGNYSITIKLIDRDQSDAVIAEKKFDFTVNQKQNQTSPVQPGDTNLGNNQNNVVEPEKTEETPINQTNQTEEMSFSEKSEENKIVPSELPKTGYDGYKIISIILITLLVLYFGLSISLRKQNKKK